MNLQFETAGIGSRAIAMTIDTLIMTLIVFIAALAIPAGFYDGQLTLDEQETYIALVIILSTFINLVYFMLFELLLKGQTPGKKLARIRVVKINGSPATAGSIIMRNLLRVIDQLPIFYLAGIITAFVHPQERRLGDLIAGTMVVKEFKRKTLNLTAQTLISLPPDIFLNPQEIMTLQSFFQRQKELAPARQTQLAAEYIEYFSIKYNIYPNDGDNTTDFLRALLDRGQEGITHKAE